MFPCCAGRDSKKSDESVGDDAAASASLLLSSPRGSTGFASSVHAPAFLAHLPHPCRPAAHGCVSVLGSLSSGSTAAELDEAESDKSARPLDEPTSLSTVFVLRKIEATPSFLHNPYILSGYRCYFSFGLACKSLFRWHNETINVWTHLAPGLWFTWRMYSALALELPALAAAGSVPIDRLDYVYHSVFYLSLLACMFNSAGYHLLGCMDYSSHACLYRCDILGILSLILGSFLPGIGYAFACRPWARGIYMGVISVLVLALVVMFNSAACASRRFHALRVGCLVATISFALLPTFHWILLVHPADFPDLALGTFLLPLCAMLGCYLAGFVLYSRHVPEVWSPGRFDFALQSHNFWHMLVVAAATIWEGEIGEMMRRKGMVVCISAGGADGAAALDIGVEAGE